MTFRYVENQTEYIFYRATAHGFDVLAASRDDGKIQDVIWTVETTHVPEDDEEARDILRSLQWAQNMERCLDAAL